MDDTEPIDEIVEKVDQRNLWRRAEDIRNKVIIFGLVGLVFAAGVAWTTAVVTVNQKVDKGVFLEHVAQSDRRFLSDSITRVVNAAALARIEAKQDSTNARLQAFVCNGKPGYCR